MNFASCSDKTDDPISVDLKEKVNFLSTSLLLCSLHFSVRLCLLLFLYFLFTFLISFSFHFSFFSFLFLFIGLLSSFFFFPCSNPTKFSCLLHSHSFEIFIFFIFFVLPFDILFLFSPFFLLFHSFDTWLNVNHSHKCTT